MQHDMVLMGFFGLANNAKFKYDKYFGIFPSGEKPLWRSCSRSSMRR